MHAAQELATALNLRRPRSADASAESVAGRPAAAKRQRHLTDLLPATSGEEPLAPAAGQQQAQRHQQARPPAEQQPQRKERQQPEGSVAVAVAGWSSSAFPLLSEGPRLQERSLLDQLYPVQPSHVAAEAPQQGGAAAAAAAGGVRHTPLLPAGRTLPRAALAGASLWAGAGTCQPVAPLLAARLAEREAGDPEATAARRQPLARGGTAYPVDLETRALKRLKLEALRDELKQHEATVADLRRMVQELEREVAGGEEAGGSAGGAS